ncbi:hypothetical protein [Pseudoalteromonas nigrifaciens]|uniref:hypothetical protein n=1 Tax=Pseudoalteromonas nigrifaciens TaxID=28109 RepID=UPI003FD57FB5
MKVKLLIVTIAALAVFFTGSAFANQVKDAAELFQQGGAQAAGAQNGFLQVAGLVGLIIFAISGIKLFNGRDNGQEGKGKMWAALGGGVFLMGLWTFAAITSNTFTGDTKTAEQMKSIVDGGGSN